MASSRMSYSRFLEYLDMGRVKKVCGGLVPGFEEGGRMLNCVCFIQF